MTIDQELVDRYMEAFTKDVRIANSHAIRSFLHGNLNWADWIEILDLVVARHNPTYP